MPLNTTEATAVLVAALRDSEAADEFADIGVSEKGGPPVRAIKAIILTRLRTSPTIYNVTQAGNGDVYVCSTGVDTTSFTFRITASQEYSAWFTTRPTELAELVSQQRLFLVAWNRRGTSFDREVLVMAVEPERIVAAVRGVYGDREQPLANHEDLRVRIYAPEMDGDDFRITIDGSETSEDVAPTEQAVLVFSPAEQELIDSARAGIDIVDSHLAHLRARSAAVRGQGFEGSAALRQALEEYSMNVAKCYFRENDFAVIDVHKHRSYDLIVAKAGARLRVEVKGTRGDGSQVLLTAGEVAAAQRHAPDTILFIVRQIIVANEDTDPMCSGGIIHIREEWLPDHRDLKPYRFFYRVPQDGLILPVPPNA
jgi:hypothetical protein